MDGNNRAVLRVVEWLETIMLYTGRGVVGNNHAVLRVVEWLETIMLS